MADTEKHLVRKRFGDKLEIMDRQVILKVILKCSVVSKQKGPPRYHVISDAIVPADEETASNMKGLLDKGGPR